jgi:natural product biosynthesis luciferase-like monooxygenase protein/thioester reductase-like protein
MSELHDLPRDRRREMLAALLEKKLEAETRLGPMSHGQRALWFLHQLAPLRSAYNTLFSARVRSDVDAAALARACQTILDRHAALRTTFMLEDGEPMRRVHGRRPVVFEEIREPSLGGPALEARVLEEAQKPFDLETGPLIRVTLFRAGEVVLLLSVHHIVADLWSLALVVRELGEAYAAEVARRKPALPPIAGSYDTFVKAQADLVRGPAGEAIVRQWREELAGALEPLALPVDRPRPLVQTLRGRAIPFRIGVESTKRLKAFGRSEKVTLYTVLLAGFEALLHRYTGQADVIVGSPAAGRTAPELEAVVGYLINAVPIRGRFGHDPTFRAIVSQIGRAVVAALERQDYPFPALVERLEPARDPSRSPIFQVSFVYQKPVHEELGPFFVLEAIPGRMSLGGLELEPFHLPQQAGQFDLTLETYELGTKDAPFLSGILKYNSDLFDEVTILRLAENYRTLLDAAISGPDRPVSALPIVGEEERRRALFELNDTARPVASATIHGLFELQAARTPQEVAIVFEDRSLTYRELAVRAHRLAHRLIRLGAGPGTIVGIHLERSLDMVVAMLAVLGSGAAYLPLDPDYPAERIGFMVGDADPRIVITTARLAARSGEVSARALCIDAERDGLEREPADDPKVPPADGQLAYVIYTSGSSGKPKGVMLTHDNVVSFVAAMDERLGDPSRKTWLAVTSISFDISVLELLYPLVRGFRVVVQGRQTEALDRPGAAPRKVAPKTPLSFSLFYFAADTASGTSKYRLVLEGAKLADRRGFEAVWTPERHFHAFGGLYPNPSVIGAAIAAVTERVQIRAGSVVMPLQDPLRVAEEWSVVDNLSNGRAGVSFASGWQPNDFVLAPDRYASRREAMLRGIDEVRRLWRGEAIERRNGAGEAIEVRVLPRPIQPELPFWLTAAGNPETFRAAGAMGANVLTHLLGQRLEDLEAKIRVFREARAAGGHDRGRVTLMLHAFLGEDLDAVRAKVRGPFMAYLASSADLMKNIAVEAGVDVNAKTFTEDDRSALLEFAFDRYFATSGLFGTPDMALTMAERLAAMGVDELACLIDFGIDDDSVMESLAVLDDVRRAHAAAVSNDESPRAAGDFSLPAQIARHRVSHLQCTPSFAKMIVADPVALASLRSIDHLLIGGEAFPVALAERLTGAVGGDVIDMYGPTETTIWSSTERVGDGPHPPSGTVSIGRPIANTSFYVVDPRSLEPAPIGVPGELLIGGRGVAAGYLRRPELTSERFIPDPFQEDRRVYRTGDRVRLLADGRFEFLGRIDQQVKIRGFRVELQEIEAALATHPAIVEAAVLTFAPGEHTELVAYAVAPGGLPSDLRTFLRSKLPEAMIPSALIEVPSLPRLPNGKVDRRALPDPIRSGASTGPTYAPPRTPLERDLAALFAEVLSADRVGIHDDFFAKGGHSLLATQLLARLRERYDVQLPLRAMLEATTVADLARVLEASPDRRAKERIDLRAEAVLDPSITVAPAGAPSEAAPILLTRATGFLGAYLARELLDRTGAPIVCLVRGEEGSGRIRADLERYGLWRDGDAERIVPITVEPGERLLGLSEARFQSLAREIGAIFHNRIRSNLAQPYAALKPANVRGTEEILRLASTGPQKPVTFVSALTVFSTSHLDGESVVLETDEPRSEGLNSGYVRSRWVAERLVRIAGERGIPVLICRMGRIMGDSATGASSMDDFLTRMLIGCLELGVAPDLDTRIDITPVDYIARAVVHLGRRPASIGRIFHINNPHTIPFNAIFDLFATLGRRVRRVPYETWETELLAAPKDHALAPFLPLFYDRQASGQDSIAEESFGRRGTPAFDTSATLEALEGSGIRCPPVDATLMSTYLAAFSERGR